MKNRIFNLVSILVLLSNVSFAQWVSNNTPQERTQFQAVVKDNKIFCIGGGNNAGSTNSVDIYDLQNDTWLTNQNISMARFFSATVAGDSAIYVVGGLQSFINDNIGTNRVDIYKNGNWHIDSIPEKIWFAQGVHVGHKIIIAGGIKKFLPSSSLFEASNKVYIYDELTQAWSIDSLSQARSAIAVASDGNIAIFAGGLSDFNQVSNAVDIYNATSNTWSTASLSEARMLAAGVFADGKFYFAGGAKNGINMSSEKVDIFDGTTWTTSQLSAARAGISAVVANHKIFFTGGGNINVPGFFYTTSEALVDEFDALSNTWTYSYMNFDKMNHSAVSYNNKVYVIGGGSYSLQQNLSIMEIAEVNTGINNKSTDLDFFVSPNPASNQLIINVPKLLQTDYHIDIINANGISIINQSNLATIDISQLTNGIYFIKLITKTGTRTAKFIKN